MQSRSLKRQKQICKRKGESVPWFGYSHLLLDLKLRSTMEHQGKELLLFNNCSVVEHLVVADRVFETSGVEKNSQDVDRRPFLPLAFCLLSNQLFPRSGDTSQAVLQVPVLVEQRTVDHSELGLWRKQPGSCRGPQCRDPSQRQPTGRLLSRRFPGCLLAVARPPAAWLCCGVRLGEAS